MIPRVKSLSKCGLVIERILGKEQKPIDNQELSLLLKGKMKVEKKVKAVKKEGLNAVVGR